jgi:hypothetical protein
MSQVNALVSLITSATRDAVAEYEKHGHEPPSLDLSEPHPLDAELPSLALKKAIRTLESACERLCTTLAPPLHTIVNVSRYRMEYMLMLVD